MGVSTPMLTFVVPVYNVELYLADCLNSLLHQTVRDHTVIIVNDGSTDHSGEIAQKYAAEYPELFAYIEQENHGLGNARNQGLKHVKTPFVAFLDSDDWQDCHYVESLKRELSYHEETPDIVFSLPWIYDAHTHVTSPWKDKELLEQMFYHGVREDVPSRELRATARPEDQPLYALEPNVNRRVFKTDFLRRIHFSFPEGVKWEDVGPHFYALHHANICIAMRNCGFSYRVNTPGQITFGGGAGRLDMIPVFKGALTEAFDDNWQEYEISYIVRMMCDFTYWSIQVTNTEYIKPLVSQFHELYRSIDKKHFKAYYSTCLRGRRDILLVTALRSPFYPLLTDYFCRNIILKIGGKCAGIVKRIVRR